MSATSYDETTYETHNSSRLDDFSKKILAISLSVAFLFIIIGCVLLFLPQSKKLKVDDTISIKTEYGETFTCTFNPPDDDVYVLYVEGAVLNEVYDKESYYDFEKSFGNRYTIELDKGTKYNFEFVASSDEVSITTYLD